MTASDSHRAPTDPFAARPAGLVPGPARPRRWGRLVIVLLAPFAGLLLLEVALRFLLFSEASIARELGAPLREAGRYASQRTASEEDFWKLRILFTEPYDRWVPTPRDALMGWTSPLVAPGTYAHADEPSVGSRRPVLLYGSSYTRCAPPVTSNFTDLLEESRFGRDYRLLNHACTGYGFEQIGMLLRSTIDRYRKREPVVVVALMVDQIFDRIDMRIRQGPKPTLSLGERMSEIRIAPPDTLDPDEYVTLHPPEITSYAWNHLVYGTRLLPRWLFDRFAQRDELRERRVALMRACMLQIATELRGVEYFLVGLYNEGSINGEVPDSWRDYLWIDTARRLRMPFISTRPMFREALEAPGVSLSDLYLPGDGHPSDLGIRLIQRAIERGLDRDYDAQGRLAQGQ